MMCTYSRASRLVRMTFGEGTAGEYTYDIHLIRPCQLESWSVRCSNVRGCQLRSKVDVYMHSHTWHYYYLHCAVLYCTCCMGTVILYRIWNRTLQLTLSNQRPKQVEVNGILVVPREHGESHQMLNWSSLFFNYHIQTLKSWSSLFCDFRSLSCSFVLSVCFLRSYFWRLYLS